MTRATLPPRKPSGPLSDLRIALDPGHLGGTWAQMEERWFKVGDAAPVQEGDMTLRVAQMLAPRLQQLGAKVSLVRDKLEPTTSKRPDDFEELAKEILKKGGIAHRTKILWDRPIRRRSKACIGIAIFFFIATARSGSAQKS